MSDRQAGGPGLGRRVVFLGSPEFAVPALRALAERYDVVEVITQPDRPAGRGRRLQEPPVKAAARELGLPVWQPERLAGREARERLQALRPDCGVVVAYGELLRPSLLAIPPRGFVNVHASLLPVHRGASPVAAAILDGDAETGVTIMLLDEGMDTGPILAQERTPIRSDDTRGVVEARLAELGADLLTRVLPGWLAGEVVARPQQHEQATYSGRLEREDARIDWARPADYLERLCRAMDPWPGAYTTWEGSNLKIWRGEAAPGGEGAAPGTVAPEPGPAAVVTGQGRLRLVTVQPAGKRPLPAEEFVRGRPRFIGARLGS